MSASIRQSTQWSVRVARAADTELMGKVLYDGLSTTACFAVVWGNTKKEDWINVQADYCAQHIDQPNSVAFVAQDASGIVTGMAYGKFIPEAGTPKGDPIIGTDQRQLQKLENGTTQKMLTEKYGSIFCKYSLTWAGRGKARSLSNSPSIGSQGWG
jgi:hypothetical protein